MNHEEKRDQMIRETFDRCLSGIDTLPSKRPEILRKMQQTSGNREPFRFRVPALAAALVVLLCVGVLALRGQPGFTGRPDPLHPVDLYTTQPETVPLSEGTGAETASIQRIPQALLDNYPQLKTLEKDFTFLDAAGRTDDTAYIDGYYYDGETLILLAVENGPVEDWDPVPDQPYGMNRTETTPEDLAPLYSRNPVVQAKWEESIRNKVPVGMTWYERNIGTALMNKDRNRYHFENNTLGYLTAAYREDGAHVSCYRYDEPLPAGLRNMDSFDLYLNVTPIQIDYWSDGDTVYTRTTYQTDSESVSAHIVNNHAEEKVYTGQGTFRDEPLTVRAETSKAAFRLTFSGINEDDPYAYIPLPENTRLEILVQDENGNTLWYKNIGADVLVENADYFEFFSVPQTFSVPEKPGLAEFPASLKVYLIESPLSDVPWEQWGIESKGTDPDPREIGPGVEPMAVLTPENP